ncbi:unnamed protein product [Trypanosoma congolense IL3000]|uniref:WGS project CAEQ00000000 data, annotated contig 273 n=1 Tax=Trypanosoma congolense (strain IL3000) TaxID=1068625 RepID=F9WEI8_TRYCI|nr:unnamed protein product [Trypanosoma congolense IL3000]
MAIVTLRGATCQRLTSLGVGALLAGRRLQSNSSNNNTGNNTGSFGDEPGGAILRPQRRSRGVEPRLVKQKVAESASHTSEIEGASDGASGVCGRMQQKGMTTAKQAVCELKHFDDVSSDMTAHDPATVVVIDPRRKVLHLSPSQRELVWSARRRQYQDLLMRIVTCLESHLSPIEKCHVLIALHEEVIDNRIRLRADTYEDIFHVFYAVGTIGNTSPSLDAEELVDRSQHVPASLLPAEFASPNVAAASIVSGPVLQSLWGMYRYMVDSGTNPTPRVVQYVMGLLERYRRRDAIVEARAHSLMMDLDRFHLAPTEYTVASYIGVCDVNSVMHLAVARVTDYRTRHERQVSPGVYTRLLFGLAHNQQYSEGLACLAAIDSTAITPQLLNAALHVTRHSRDPLSAFSLYKSVMGQRRRGACDMAPSEHTFTILLEAMEKAQSYDELDYFLSEMRKYRVKGNSVTLNKLLRVLLKLGRCEEAEALMGTMDKKGVTVFDEVRRECATCSSASPRCAAEANEGSLRE